MLNEKMEAEAYLGEVNSGCRIQPAIFTGQYNGQMNGLEEVLIVIARKFMFHHMKATTCTAEVHDKCIMALKLWCGFESGEELKTYREDDCVKNWLKEYPCADKWLKSYYEECIERKSKKEYDWDYYKKKGNELLNNSKVYQATSYSYENVLADAIPYGKLKEYYLVIKLEDDMWDSLRAEKTSRKVDKRTKRKILKFMSAYLLAKRFCGQQTVLLKKIPMLYWMGYESDNTVNWFPVQTWNGASICTRTRYSDFLKVSMHTEFMETYDIHLIEEEQILEYIEAGYAVYKDVGHGSKDVNALQKVN